MGKSTDRFLDIHLLASDDWYDFGANIQTGQSYQTATHKNSLGTKFEILVTAPIGGGVATRSKPPDPLPDKGFIAMGLTTSEMKSQKRDEDHAKLIAWVSDPGHKGKLRLNAHGEGGGSIYMHTSKKKLSGNPGNAAEYVNAGHLAPWLKLHSLMNKPTQKEKWLYVMSYDKVIREQGLATVCLALCHAADPKSNTLAGDVTMPSVGIVARGLKEAGFEGIKVTGAMDSVTVAMSRQQIEGTVKATMIRDGQALDQKTITASVDHLMSRYPTGVKPGQWLEIINEFPYDGRYRRLAHTAYKKSQIS